MPTVKHDSGGVMTWTCFAATGSGHLIVSESNLHISILDKTGSRNKIWLQAQQQNYNRTAKKGKSQCAAMDWSAVLGP